MIPLSNMYVPCNIWDILIKQILWDFSYQIFKFNWVSDILSGNITRRLDTSSEFQGSKSVPMDRQFFAAAFIVLTHRIGCIEVGPIGERNPSTVYLDEETRKKNSCLETRGSQVGGVTHGGMTLNTVDLLLSDRLPSHLPMVMPRS